MVGLVGCKHIMGLVGCGTSLDGSHPPFRGDVLADCLHHPPPEQLHDELIEGLCINRCIIRGGVDAEVWTGPGNCWGSPMVGRRNTRCIFLLPRAQGRRLVLLELHPCKLSEQATTG